MDLLPLALRVGASLAAVVGLVWLLSRAARRRGAGAAAVDATRFAVIGRQSLSRSAGVTVVRVADEALVLGVTDAAVQLLARMPITAVTAAGREGAAPEVLAAPAVAAAPAAVPAQRSPRGERPARRATESSVGARTERPARSALSGSALSPATWSLAVEALRERTTRR